MNVKDIILGSSVCLLMVSCKNDTTNQTAQQAKPQQVVQDTTNDEYQQDTVVRVVEEQELIQPEKAQAPSADELENEKFRQAELARRARLREKVGITDYTPPPSKKKPKATTVKKQVTETKPKPKTKKIPSGSNTGKAAITFEELNFLFDTLTEGDVINHSFVFKNTGNAPLQVTNATATCGCTRPSFPFIEIMPGEEGKIGVTYNSRTKSGNQAPVIEVFTNIRETPYTLTLNGYVKDKPKKEGTKTDTLTQKPF